MLQKRIEARKLTHTCVTQGIEAPALTHTCVTEANRSTHNNEDFNAPHFKITLIYRTPFFKNVNKSTLTRVLYRSKYTHMTRSK